MGCILYLLAGFFAGVIGGMGMGGGTVMIPALTLILGVEQKAAQAANLVAFLPMALAVLPSHARSGLLKTDGVLFIIIPALVSSALGGLAAAIFPAAALRRLFGWFLIALAIKGTFSLKAALQKAKKLSGRKAF